MNAFVSFASKQRPCPWQCRAERTFKICSHNPTGLQQAYGLVYVRVSQNLTDWRSPPLMLAARLEVLKRARFSLRAPPVVQVPRHRDRRSHSHHVAGPNSTSHPQ